jgi:hypothetical protein
MTPRWVSTWLVVLAVVLVAQGAAHAIAVFGFGSYTSVVDLNANDSIPDILSTLAIAAAAVGAARLGRSHTGYEAESWALSVLLLLVVAADIVHTGIESVSALGASVALVLVGVAILVWRVVRRTSRPVPALLQGGLACLAGSLAVSFVFHRVDGYLDVARADVVYEGKVILKQGFELAGWWLMALGLWAARPRPVTGPSAQLLPERSTIIRS